MKIKKIVRWVVVIAVFGYVGTKYAGNYYYSEAMNHMRAKRYHLAEENFIKSSYFTPEKTSIYHNLGVINHNLKKFVLSINQFNIAVKNKKDTNDENDINRLYFTYFCRGLTFMKMKDYRSAIRDFKASVKLKKSGVTYLNMAGAYSYLDDYKKSIFYYKKARVHISLGHKYLATGMLGTLYIYDGKCKKSLGVFKQAEKESLHAIKRKKKDHPKAFVALHKSGFYLATKKHEEAIHILLKNKKYMYNSLVRYNESLAVNYLCLENVNKALAYINKAIKSKGRTFSYGIKGQIYYKVKKYALAKKQYDKSIALNKENDFSLYNRGITFYAMEEVEKAKRDISKSMKFMRKNGNVRLLKLALKTMKAIESPSEKSEKKQFESIYWHTERCSKK